MASLFPDSPTAPVQQRGRLDVKLLHRMECKACPLSTIKSEYSNVPASGVEKPLVYVLSDVAGMSEEAISLFHSKIARDDRKVLRYNSLVRTRPLKEGALDPVAVECCRPSVIRDIERTQPKVIFGLGTAPLEWVMGSSLQGITMWRGRRTPVKVGKHSCWYYPLSDPEYLLKIRRSANDAGSEEERMLKFDLQRAFAELDTLPEPRVHTPQDVWRGLECITEGGQAGLQAIEERLNWALDQPTLGVDYETNCLRPYKAGAKVLTAALATSEEGFAFPFEHPDAEWSEGELKTVEGLWIDFLKTYKGVKFVHNLAFELEWTGVYFDPKLLRIGQWEDTSVQASILDERKGNHKPGCFSLEFLVQQYFGFNLKKLSNLDRKNLAEVPVELVLCYNGGDSKYHCQLGLVQRQLIKDKGLEDVYIDALRRVPTVVLTQMKGIPVDQKEVHRLQKKYDTRIGKVEAEIFALPVVRKFEAAKGVKFKPLSDKDVLYVFKDLLGCEECTVYDKRKKKDRYSCDESVLEKIDHPLSKMLLQLRKANKRRSTYIDPLDLEFEDTVVYPDGLSHGTFNTIFAETGRLSASDPNWQNFPKRDGEAKEVRKQVKAPSGCVVVAFDYSSLEARVIGTMTRDSVFVKALWEKYDVHMDEAEHLSRAYPARVGGKKNFTDKKVMKDFRTDVKNQWTFPLFFGASLQSAAGYLEIPEDKLAPEYNRFWKVFSGVKVWQEELLEFYKTYGYVECMTGRRRRGPLSLNKVINSPVQGTAAEVVMDAMSRLSETGDPELQPEINIHDDFTYCRVPVNRVDSIAEKVITGMLDVPYDWADVVPWGVEMSVGPNWLELSDCGSFFSDDWFRKKDK